MLSVKNCLILLLVLCLMASNPLSILSSLTIPPAYAQNPVNTQASVHTNSIIDDIGNAIIGFLNMIKGVINFISWILNIIGGILGFIGSIIALVLNVIIDGIINSIASIAAAISNNVAIVPTIIQCGISCPVFDLGCYMGCVQKAVNPSAYVETIEPTPTLIPLPQESETQNNEEGRGAPNSNTSNNQPFIPTITPEGLPPPDVAMYRPAPDIFYGNQTTNRSTSFIIGTTGIELDLNKPENWLILLDLIAREEISPLDVSRLVQTVRERGIYHPGQQVHPILQE